MSSGICYQFLIIQMNAFTEYILDEAKVKLSLSYIKGLPMPEEIQVRQPNNRYLVLLPVYSIDKSIKLFYTIILFFK